MKKFGEIVFTKYGPYTVVDTDLFDEHGKKIDTPRVYSLCRCGGSTHRPFCDGTHGKNGFVGEQVKPVGHTKLYSGDKINIYDNRRICCHAGECHLENVFSPGKSPWINPNGTPDVEKIIEIIKLCPSGALTYEVDGEHISAWFDEQRIVVTGEGYLQVQGGVVLKDDQSSCEKLISKEHFTLCSCGKSQNKPFCDGSHLE